MDKEIKSSTASKRDRIRAGIFGISGYAGQKLAEALAAHPYVDLAAGFVAPEEGNPELSELIPRLRGVLSLRCSNKPDWKFIEDSCDVVFLALPHSVSMAYVPDVLAIEKKVIDLSADFRFSCLDTYETFYGKHLCPAYLEEVVYGLPEINRDRIRTSRLIANPGCYPTSVLLALIPLASRGLLEPELIVDSKSGVTGAGRTPSLVSLFPECNENIRAYKIGEHRHAPEMEEILNSVSEVSHRIIFVPHLAPYNQGILSTCYARLNKPLSQDDLAGIYSSHYAGEPFVRMRDYGVSPSVRYVRDTNFCDIGYKLLDSRNIVVISAIDNLIKGASGQAVQNMNIMFGFPETLPFFV